MAQEWRGKSHVPAAEHSPQRQWCCIFRLPRRRVGLPADKVPGIRRAGVEVPADVSRGEEPLPPGTLTPRRVARRHRSGSPVPECRAELQPLKKQNSMGQDDRLQGSQLSPARRSLGRDPPAHRSGDAPTTSAASDASTQQHAHTPGLQQAVSMSPAQQQQQQAARRASSGDTPQGSPTARANNTCPPFGSKAVIGRRSKMEDACVVVPSLLSVVVDSGGLEESLPPRVAPLLRSARVITRTSPGSGASAEGSLNSSLTSGGSGPRPAGPLSDGDTSGSSVRETLHFFGVFDGHGGADAALHCSRVLHTRVREVFEGNEALLRGDDGGLEAALPRGAAAGEAADEVKPPPAPSADASVLDIAASLSAAGTTTTGTTIGSGPERSDDSSTLGFVPPEEAAAVAAAAAAAAASTAAAAAMQGASPPGASPLSLSVGREAVEAALTRAFHLTDDEFGRAGGYEHLALVGTTAVVVLIGASMLYVANAGDSRAVLCRDGLALPLTDDHKAAREDETARVEAAGGQILFWNGVRVMGLLAVSRAIGDHSLRPYVIAEPEVTIVHRHPADELLVMASDGLWDVMGNQEACTLARKCLLRARQRGSSRQSAARVAATVLTRAAVDRGSRDNVTVVVVDLSSASPEEAVAEAASAERQAVLGGIAEAPAPQAPSAPPRASEGGESATSRQQQQERSGSGGAASSSGAAGSGGGAGTAAGVQGESPGVRVRASPSFPSSPFDAPPQAAPGDPGAGPAFTSGIPSGDAAALPGVPQASFRLAPSPMESCFSSNAIAPRFSTGAGKGVTGVQPPP
ncbi:hypothetical protein ACKKBG_A24055 [Auxenochlorella protothecoides x Auxenochlorella symbiontica]